MLASLCIALIATSVALSDGAGNGKPVTAALCDHSVAEAHVLVRANPPLVPPAIASPGWQGTTPNAVINNSLPAALLPPVALSADVSGWVLTHSRHERWQIDAWQYYLTAPLSLTDDAQINVRYRIPIRMARPDRRLD
jgi:hypothetical protein